MMIKSALKSTTVEIIQVLQTSSRASYSAYLQQQKLFRSYRHNPNRGCLTSTTVEIIQVLQTSRTSSRTSNLQQQKLFRSYRHPKMTAYSLVSTTVEIIQVLQTNFEIKQDGDLQQQKLFRSYRPAYDFMQNKIYNSRNYLGLIDNGL